jgi:aspartyl aminopeptidase
VLQSFPKILVTSLIAIFLVTTRSGTEASSKKDDYGSRGNIWKTISASERREVMDLAERFKKLISAARSELMMVRETIRFAESRGFRLWDPEQRNSPRPGARYYAVNRDRTVLLWVVGQKPLSAGMRLINSHIDSPRLELKPHPLKVRTNTVTLDTFVHGFIRTYQWVNIPLALTGRVDLKDGNTVWLEVGLTPSDPVLFIPDLAPHVDRDLRSRTRSEVIKIEELEPLLTTTPPSEQSDLEGVIEQAEHMIRSQYGIEPDDWMSADIQIVPAAEPRDVGIDRAAFAAYGLDDRLTGIINLYALDNVKSPAHTAMAYLVADEEVGSEWNVSASSEWFRKVISEMIRAEAGSVTELDVMTTFGNTEMITADTTSATNPIWPEPQSKGNASILHHGLVIKLYGPGRSPNSEFVARLRKLLDDANIPWHTHTYQAGYGGGTIARYFGAMNMEVTDWGIGIWSAHGPLEVASKADLWALWKGFIAFFES